MHSIHLTPPLNVSVAEALAALDIALDVADGYTTTALETSRAHAAAI